MRESLPRLAICFLTVALLAVPMAAIQMTNEPRVESNITSVERRGIGSRSNGTNLIENPSFEFGFNNKPARWIFDKQGQETEPLWDSKYSHSGCKSAGIINLDTNALNGWCANGGYGPKIKIEPDKYYYVGFWYKLTGNPNDSAILVCMAEYREGGYWNDGMVKFIKSPSYHGWQYVEFNCSDPGDEDFYLNENTRYVDLVFAWQTIRPFEKPSPDVEMRFDDMFFGPVGDVEEEYPPYEPILQGNDTVKWKKEYKLQAHVYDPNDDKINLIVQWDWEDETNTTYGPFESDTTVTLSHTYDTLGDIGDKTIKVKAVDEDGLESGWAYKSLRVKLIKAKHTDLFDRLPLICWLLTLV